ncbi:MAG: glycosyltransferase family 2 protein [Spirochaetes bacterium]|nr:glycosyltransferase family 2 protein [Spirochaetota bacterium]
MAKKKTQIYLSIVVPVYNEEESIIPFYERTIKVIKKLKKTYEIIFINDGSTDSTYNVLNKLHKKDRNVKLLDFSRNFGKEIALTAGLDAASGSGVVPIDVDLQDPPELIHEMIKKWKSGYDVVYATRTSRRGESLLKKVTAFIFYKVIRVFTKFNIPANTGDFRLMDEKVVRALGELREHHRFMKGLFSWVGYKQTCVEYQRDPRFVGTTKWKYGKLINFAIEGITSFSYIPLRFSTYLGFTISIFSFLYAAFLITKKLIYGVSVAGYPSMMVAILFLGGIQLLSIGVIGEYVGRIYNETKNRKLYFIRETKGIKNTNDVKKV